MLFSMAISFANPYLNTGPSQPLTRENHMCWRQRDQPWTLQPIAPTSSSGDSRHLKAMQSKDCPMPPAKIFQRLTAFCHQNLISSLILCNIDLLCPELPAVSLPRRDALIFLGPGSAEFSFMTWKGPAW